MSKFACPSLYALNSDGKYKNMLLPITLLDYQKDLQLKRQQEQVYIYGKIRKKWLVLQPEELVRQLLLEYLIQEKAYPSNRIRSEFGLKVNGLQKRCDILVFDHDLQPILMVECKAAKVKVTEAVFEQVAIYNRTLKVPYLLVSNGPVNYCSKVCFDSEEVSFLSEIPTYKELLASVQY